MKFKSSISEIFNLFGLVTVLGCGSLFSVPTTASHSNVHSDRVRVRLAEHFGVPAVENAMEKQLARFNSVRMDGRRLHPLSVVKNSGSRSAIFPNGNASNLSYWDPNVAMKLRSRRFREREELDKNYFRRPKASFTDNALLSIEDYQRELRDLKDMDVSNGLRALPMRQMGPLCGVFLHPLFHAELRALNITSYVLRNVYVSARARLRKLTIVFESSSHLRPQHFTIQLPDRTFLRGVQFVLQAGKDTRNVKKVTIMDPVQRFSVSLDVSCCIIPQFLKGASLIPLARGITTGSLTMYTSNFMIVRNFTYRSGCPAAYFWAGTGRSISQGFKIPVATLGVNSLPTYTNQDVHLGLPKPYTWYDVNYVAVFCPARRQVLAYRLLPKTLWRRVILPPAITTLDVAKNLKLI